MTRFTSFLIVGTLVTAFASLSMGATTFSSNMTAPVTTASNMTTPASNMTTPASNMTTSKVTALASLSTATPTLASKLTTPVTTRASNMTTRASNMTSRASNMTTAAGNTTTPASNMTTAASNTTTTPGNTTTTPGNTTTISSNTTTSTSTPVTSSGTTSVPVARWSVRDKDGKLCMLMDFEGTVSYIGAPIQIPSSATTDRSNCSVSSFAAFVLVFEHDESIERRYWKVGLNFTADGSSYKLREVAMSTWTFGSSTSYSISRDFFDVPMGNYYTCKSFNQSLSIFELKLTNPSFQPFVQKTKKGDNLGEPYECRVNNGFIIGLLIGIVIAVIIVIAAVIGVGCYVVKRIRKGTSPPPYVPTN